MHVKSYWPPPGRGENRPGVKAPAEGKVPACRKRRLNGTLSSLSLFTIGDGGWLKSTCLS